MHRRSIVLIASLLASGLALGGCGNIDPTEWFNTKKPLPGDRKAVFPEGVPGVPEGVPPDLVQGYKPPVEPVPEPLPMQDKPAAKPKPKPKVAAAPKPAAAPRPQTHQQQGGQSAWPDAAPGQAQQPAGQSAFPDPPRQTR